MDNFVFFKLGNLHFGLGEEPIFNYKNQGEPEREDIRDNRFEFVQFQIHKLLGLMQMADIKAQFVLGANTILISIFVFSFPNIRDVFLSIPLLALVGYSILLTVFLLTALVSMVGAFLVVFPRHTPFPQNDTYKPLSYFREIALSYKDAGSYSQALLNASQEEILISAAREIHNISMGANKKFTILQSSTRWLTISVVLWTLSILATFLNLTVI